VDKNLSLFMPNYPTSLCWLRRDLRLDDHAALYHALRQSDAVHCVFVFDTDILDALTNKADRRVEFIWHSLHELNARLHELGSTLHVLHGSAMTEIPRLANELNAQAVFCNRDYEPAAMARDAQVSSLLAQSGIEFFDCKDQVIFERDEVLNGAGKPYGVFTPYKNAWLKKLNNFYLRSYPSEAYFSALAPCPPSALPTLESLGFSPTNLLTLGIKTGSRGGQILLADFLQRMAHYQATRDFPAVKGVSYLSVHLRFGTLSIRHLATCAVQQDNLGSATWLSELIWREFYQMLLWHNPQLAAGRAFKSQFEALKFPNSTDKFAAWCEARTGYPLVDAAMRQLNQTGFMHNRLRMIAASFLVKDLHVDWRWGERYFAQHLIDFDLSANNGGWQWSASTGCDAQPWFRIFNPITQSEKFDPQGKFIRRYVPELARCADQYLHAPWLMPAGEQQRCGVKIGVDYPAPMVDHSVAREQTLQLFKAAG
jgi:deoxyribodipyrimidine photo-lyase